MDLIVYLWSPWTRVPSVTCRWVSGNKLLLWICSLTRAKSGFESLTREKLDDDLGKIKSKWDLPDAKQMGRWWGEAVCFHQTGAPTVRAVVHPSSCLGDCWQYTFPLPTAYLMACQNVIKWACQYNLPLSSRRNSERPPTLFACLAQANKVKRLMWCKFTNNSTLFWALCTFEPPAPFTSSKTP